MSATNGHATLEVGEVYTKAHELCQRTGDKVQTFAVQQELRVFYGWRGAWLVSRQLAEENLALAQKLDSLELLQYAHRGMDVVLHALGELPLAQAHLERAIRQPVGQPRRFGHLFTDDGLQASLRHSALLLWLLGYPDQARTRLHEVLAAFSPFLRIQNIRATIPSYRNTQPFQS